MHQQVLLSGRRVAVGRLQALILCLKVCHCYSGFSLTVKPEPLLQTKTGAAVEGREGNGGGLNEKRTEHRLVVSGKCDTFTLCLLVNI